MLFALLASSSVVGQIDSSEVDSVQVKKWGKAYSYTGTPKKWKLLLGFDARRSFFSGRPVKINGVRLGAELWGIHRFGLAFYGLSRNLVFKDIAVREPDATDTSYLRFDANYAGVFYERVVYATRRWEFALPISFGAGEVRASYTDTTGFYKPLLEKPFSALTPGVTIRFKPLRWLSIGTGLGYRVVFDTDREIKDAFASIYYKYGVSILFGEIYRMLFKKDQECQRLKRG